MATKKVSLGGVRVSSETLDKLKDLHMKEADRWKRSGKRISFSLFVETLLAGYCNDRLELRKQMDRLSDMPDTGFED